MTKKQLLEDIELDPARYFRAPGDVLRDRRFHDDERLRILQAWERRAPNSSDRDSAGPEAAERRRDLTAARKEIERRLRAAGDHPGIGP